MAKKSKREAYIVFVGRKPGIYRTWEECKAQVDGYSGQRQKGFEKYHQAEEAWETWELRPQEVLTLPSAKPAAKIVLDGRDVNLRNGDGKRVYDLTSNNENEPAPKRMKHVAQPPLPKYLSVEPRKQSEIRSRYFDQPPVPTQSIIDLTEDGSDDEVSENKDYINLNQPKNLWFVDTIPTDPSGLLAQYNADEEGDSEADYDWAQHIILTPEQQAVVDIALKGHSIFLTGAAGCGKTVTLKKILQSFRHIGKQIQVVAPTGIAALPLGGKTTFSFLGWNPDSLQKPIDELSKKPTKSTRKRLEKLQVLIVEEISMVENQFLERMNLFLQALKKSQKPMGGLQVIFLGDFHQLPPVLPFERCLGCGGPMRKGAQRICMSKEHKYYNCGQPFEEADKWAFNAPVWTDLKLRHVKLEQIHRQKSGRFQDILNKVRNGILLTVEEWRELETHKPVPKGQVAVKLMSKRHAVTAWNNRELGVIRSKPFDWKAVDAMKNLPVYGEVDDGFKVGPNNWENFDEERDPFKDHKITDNLTLKLGAKVVLLINLDPESGLVNGSQGEVIAFVKSDSDEEIAKAKLYETRKEKSAWDTEQLTTFKRQGTLEPVVRFANGVTRTMSAFVSTSRKGTPQKPYLMSRTQIPLALAWALSIHKSQGMTLDYVQVSSKDIFESGQLYVALSRATSLDGLTLTGWTREQMLVDKDVLAFYKRTRWEQLQ